MRRPTGIVEWEGPVPPVPTSRLEPVVEDDAVLMWVRSGTLTVLVEEREPIVATAGQAVWVPPSLPHSAWLDEGSVAVPIITEVLDVPDPLARACVVAVPEAWENWLLRRVAGWFGFSSGVGPDRSHLFDLLAQVGPDEEAPEVRTLPPLPRSPQARAVVDRLLRHPDTSVGLAELAADAMTSPRTLQRRLRDETGHSLAQWRTAVRVHAAAAYLAKGRDLGWIAHHVGYASITGFTHAFTARMGVSPGRYAARCAETGRPDDPFVRQLATLVGPPVAAPERPDLPTAPQASWVPSFDSVLWVRSGTVAVEVAGRTWDLESGDVVWLPHGLPHVLSVADDAVVLPLGWKPPAQPVRSETLHVTRVPDSVEMELFLLHTMVANHFLLRPTAHDEHGFLDLLRPSTRSVTETAPTPLGAVVAAVIDDPSDGRSLAEWAGGLGAEPRDLRREFTDVMGESFPRWRAKVRMTEARALMWDGHPPSVVARRLGYSHLPAFSKAFTASHGIPPREWMRREAG